MKIPKTFEIETENLLLRIPTKDDFPSIFSATRYKGFNDGMPWEPPNNLEELSEPLKNSIKSWEEGKGYSFTILQKDIMKFSGRISIRKTIEQDIWDVGFWTHPEEQKKGIMTEALKSILEFGFKQLLAKKIEASHAIWNIASGKVLKRNGLEFVKYIEKGFMKKDKWVDENKLAIDRKTWNNLPNY